MKAAARQGTASTAHDGGAMSVRFARFDRNWKQVEETAVDARVCECCPTAAAVTAEGVIAAYRNRSDDEIRDNYVVAARQRQVDRRRSRCFNDSWKIAACPVNGPALSASGTRVAMSWFTVKDDQGQAYAAFSQDAGRRSARRFASTMAASLGRVDVELLPDGSALATWIEFAGSTFAEQRSGAVPRAPHRPQRHALGAGHHRRHRRQPRQRLSARGDRQRRSRLRVDRIGRRRRPAGRTATARCRRSRDGPS